MLKILLSGANGYLGKGVVKQLLDDGIEVVATDYKDNLIDTRATIKTADLIYSFVSLQNKPYKTIKYKLWNLNKI